MLDFITMTDGYKLDHRRQYPPNTQFVYSNFTPRTSRVPGDDHVVFFGLQYFLKRYFQEHAAQTFFDAQKDKVLRRYRQMLDNYLGPNNVGVDHIADLHDLGYIPLRFYALPEGTRVPLRVPMFTYVNTLPEFYWVTNYFETLLSSVLWPACTSATTARKYRVLLEAGAAATGADRSGVPFQAHDFSFRGLTHPEHAALSGAAHLLSFTGSDVIPAIQLLEDYYRADGLVAGTVPATEHSVMCAGGRDTERDTYARLMGVYPSGYLSVVSDTWDLWNVIENILPSLKDQIMARDGKLVIRPDSGDPADILCGTNHAIDGVGTAKYKGVVELLWDKFGGTVNEAGFKVLDSHVGVIYGDSITIDRCNDIMQRLIKKGFATTNVVLGVGSYTYNYVTRDTYGFAVKSTWTMVDDQVRMLSKDPVTDNGVKKSATGLISVIRDGDTLRAIDGIEMFDDERCEHNLLRTVWVNGFSRSHETLAAIRKRVLED